MYDPPMTSFSSLSVLFMTACLAGLMNDVVTKTRGEGTRGDTGGFGNLVSSQTQKFSWVTGEDQAPVIETKRLEDIHGVRVRTALHTLAAMGSSKHHQILIGGRDAPPHPTVREIAKELQI
jgi:hypothetical protein